jgi:uncharacterized membrane protein
MAGGFDQLIANMQSMGFFQFLFPFLLALAILYGVMSLTLRDRLPKSAMGVISLVISFFVMLYSSWNTMIVQFFANISGTWLIVASGILFVLILLGLTGFKMDELFKNDKAKWITILVVVFIGILIFFGAGGGMFFNLPLTSDFWTILFFVAILAIVVFWMGQEGDKGAPASTPH